jgi:hypothetical protein
VTLTFHKKPKLAGRKETALGRHIIGGYAICHYCLSKTLVPQHCPLCSSKMTMIGLGSQRLEEEVAKKLPTARVRRIDSDSMMGKDYYAVLRDFAEQKIDILAGTQMLAKGLQRYFCPISARTNGPTNSSAKWQDGPGVAKKAEPSMSRHSLRGSRQLNSR